ncbi:ovarian cancer G-protein coupled receptor 1-like [Pangasianodon hypophthalmus]|uniref:ovarian cancer G-protein coupled receptor 1-like n=1 Tax=Pangasianodon hypophthalmus TaxID=310915 RepID=UPI002307313D|nr:ovarian cancer G-protein coupled receptor 1-like [Pangasianodon hypophthalmus]
MLLSTDTNFLTAIMDENTSISEHNSSCTYNDTVDAYMYPAAYSLFFIFGLAGNCLSLYVAWIIMRRGNSLAVYLVSLSICDLLYTLTLPVWIMLAMQQTVNDTLCSLIAVIMYNSFYVGSGLLCCISVDRYLAVVFPLYFARLHEVRTAALVSIFVWLIEISLHIGLLAHKDELRQFSISRLCEEKIPMDSNRAHVAIIRVVLSFLIPLFVMAFCFHQIMVSLRKSASTEASERNKIRKLLCILLLVYVVSFTPFQVVMFVRGVWETDKCDIAKQLRNVYMVFVATTTINSVLDPVVYCLMTESAKTEIRSLYMKCQHQLSKTFSVLRLSSSSTA